MARRKKSSGPVEPKRSPIKVYPIPRISRDTKKPTEPWVILDKLLEKSTFRPIRMCSIKLWWQKDWKVDADGIATGATVCKASEIDRNLVEEHAPKGVSLDINIRIAEKAWQHYSDKKKEQLIFHELCHVHPAKNAKGEQKYDMKNRPLWRIGRHPISTFPEELAEYGEEAVIGNNQAVLDAMHKASEPLLAAAETTKKGEVDKGASK